MNAKSNRALRYCGLAAVSTVLSAALLGGQSSPPSQAGSQGTPSGQVQAQVQKQVQKNEPPPPAQALNGTWKLNAEKSDDAEEKLRATPEQDVPDGPDSIPSVSQTTPSSAGRRSQGNGVPYGRPGGSGPLGGPLPVEKDIKAHQKLLEMLHHSPLLMVEVKDGEFDFTDQDKQKRAFFTDGRKLQKSKDDSYKELAANWNAGRLSFDEKGPRGEKITVTFQPMRNTSQLIETFQVDSSKIYSPVVIRYVYDLVPENQ
jgi:hypothetical protein